MKLNALIHTHNTHTHTIYIYIFTDDSNDDERPYIEMLKLYLIKGMYNHNSSLTNRKYSNNITLSRNIWEVKDKTGKPPIIKWKLIKKFLVKPTADCVLKKNFVYWNS